jgi:hypothetical protein
MNVSINMDNDHPYYGGNERLIKGLLRETVHDLKDSHLIDLEVDSESYGSGYASFWDLFCYKKNGKSSTIKGDTTYTDGIAVYLCKLAPVAVMGAMERTKSKNIKGSTFLHAEDVGTLPSGNWLEIAREIRTKLEKYGFVMPESKILKQKMPFEANIQTIIGDAPYQIFDAFFHWED